ncbi:MAG: hypothetical protein H7831_03910 [Magnetococcus sp. WYHC-3]
MLIDAKLLLDSAHIMNGLANGSLVRWGSVVRDAGTGRIVQHLVESPGFTQSLLQLPLKGVVGGAVEVVGQGVTIYKVDKVQDAVGQVQQTATQVKNSVAQVQNSVTQVQQSVGAVQQSVGAVQQSLSSVLKFSQIAAAASVLTLGVSIIGFAYTGRKLNQVRNAVETLHENMHDLFQQTHSRLDTMTGQLDYLVLLARDNAEVQRSIRGSLEEIHNLLLHKEVAELQSHLEHLARFPDESCRASIPVASRVKQIMSGHALRVTPALDPSVMLRADLALRGWAVGAATEADLLMKEGLHLEAKRVIDEEYPKLKRISERWAETLLQAEVTPPLQTAYRFLTPRLREHIMPERVERIARIYAPDRERSAYAQRWARQDAEVEWGMSHQAPMDEASLNRQLAIAEFTDGLSELGSRLGSLGASAQECELRGLASSRDLVPGHDAPEGLYILPASDGVVIPA